MTPARARKLEEIGFKWSTKDPRHVPWEHRYNQLVAFKVILVTGLSKENMMIAANIWYCNFLQEKYGHSQVPIGWEVSKQNESALA